MKLKALSLLIAGLLFANHSMAGCAGKACSSVYIDRIFMQSNGGIFVGTNGDEELLNCTAVSKVYLTLDSNDRNASHLYSLLRSAQVSDTKVFVRIVENSKNCKIQHVISDR